MDISVFVVRINQPWRNTALTNLRVRVQLQKISTLSTRSKHIDWIIREATEIELQRNNTKTIASAWTNHWSSSSKCTSWIKVGHLSRKKHGVLPSNIFPLQIHSKDVHRVIQTKVTPADYRNKGLVMRRKIFRSLADLSGCSEIHPQLTSESRTQMVTILGTTPHLTPPRCSSSPGQNA
jgi:hypothetical protein